MKSSDEKPKSLNLRRKYLPGSGMGKGVIFDRPVVSKQILSELEAGKSLSKICEQPGMPTVATFLDWLEEDSALANDYARARMRGYSHLAEEILAISDETHTEIEVQETDAEGNPLTREDGSPVLKKVRVPLSADVIARNRLRIDTRKWILSKMLPKVYGDKLMQEVVGPGGGPVQITNINLKTLSDTELENMQKMLAKAAGAQDVVDVESKELPRP